MQYNAHIETWIDYVYSINRTMLWEDWLEWRDANYPTY